jgi:pyrroloquinoline quinone biosynthesis protein B
MRVKVLGSAAGGGFPQWNCGCSNCSGLRAGTLRGSQRTQTQVALSADPYSWFLLNASPDLRHQTLSSRDFVAPNTGRGTPIAGIVLTSADVDSVMGLLHLREFQPLRILATPSVLRILKEDNSIFRVLDRSIPPTEWVPLPLYKTIPMRGCDAQGVQTNLTCRAMTVGGDFPDYVTPSLRKDLSQNEAVVALEISHRDKSLFYAPSIPELTIACKPSIESSNVALLDGTFWTDCELIHVIGSGKRAREIGHLPLSGEGGLLDQLRNVDRARRVLIHINNTNPVLDEESLANRSARDAGFEISYDGMEFEL